MSILAVSNEAAPQKRRSSLLMGDRRMSVATSPQPKHLQLRANVQEHERTAALLAVKQAEDQLNRLASENASLLNEIEVRIGQQPWFSMTALTPVFNVPDGVSGCWLSYVDVRRRCVSKQPLSQRTSRNLIRAAGERSCQKFAASRESTPASALGVRAAIRRKAM